MDVLPFKRSGINLVLDREEKIIGMNVLLPEAPALAISATLVSEVLSSFLYSTNGLVVPSPFFAADILTCPQQTRCENYHYRR